ncbi:MAG: glutamine--fructose-6-phosphate transaminase (isomerizing), partial [Parachlamydiaceae bacterium]|nr:glutamine--fructose-6-phosphate transaminase (isomerizing) [Parachlamydiaceae bacterium]
MCGIFGYVGKRNRNPVNIVLEGLKKLEYRGYDSAGIAGISHGKVRFCKEVGKIAALEKQVELSGLSLEMAVGHTRWASHGKPNTINAHPHFDQNYTLAVVHNGIIENHASLRKKLIVEGITFVSETDTEVVAHLIGVHYKGNMLVTLREVSHLLKGAFALTIIHKDYPDTIFAISHESPIVIGLGENEAFVSSDSQAFTEHTLDAIYLSKSEIACITPGECKIYDLDMQKVDKTVEKVSSSHSVTSKGEYKHYTLKEIHEQPESIQRAIDNRLSEIYGTAQFAEMIANPIDFTSVERILILACGTSLYAGFVSSYMIEDKARIPVQVEISSEFRYKNPIVLPGTLTIAISQSGETADTIAAVRELKSKGGKVLAICNVQGSTLTREADAALMLHAGPEIGVCSTKAFTSQLTVLALLTLVFARIRHMNKEEGREFIKEIIAIPEKVREVLEQASHIEALAKKYAKFDNFFFLGRNYLYPTSLEGALKLKEISYINANGYPAGEMKHGPIALINENCPTVALCANKLTFEKLVSNLMEVKARSGKVIAIAAKNQDLSGIADDVIVIPETID